MVNELGLGLYINFEILSVHVAVEKSLYS